MERDVAAFLAEQGRPDGVRAALKLQRLFGGTGTVVHRDPQGRQQLGPIEGLDPDRRVEVTTAHGPLLAVTDREVLILERTVRGAPTSIVLAVGRDQVEVRWTDHRQFGVVPIRHIVVVAPDGRWANYAGPQVGGGRRFRALVDAVGAGATRY